MIVFAYPAKTRVERFWGFLMNVGHAKTRRREEVKTVVWSREQ